MPHLRINDINDLVTKYSLGAHVSGDVGGDKTRVSGQNTRKNGLIVSAQTAAKTERLMQKRKKKWGKPAGDSKRLMQKRKKKWGKPAGDSR
jgi:hypothetical protein